MDGIILRSKRSASITVAGLALGSLLLAGSPAGAQSVYPPYVDQQGAYQQQQVQPGWGGNTTDPRSIAGRPTNSSGSSRGLTPGP